MKMCSVSECEIVECAYNMDKACHAMAITIGDGVHPMCDTFFKSSTHGGVKNQTAGVGACKVSACCHNMDFECEAESIHVGYCGGHSHGDCMTFAAR